MLSTIAKVTVILGIGLGALRLCPRLSAAMRHAVLVGLFGIAVAVPIGARVLPAFELTVPYRGENPFVPVTLASGGDAITTMMPTIQRGEGIEHIANDRVWFTQAIIAVALAGAIIAFVPIVVGIWQTRRLRRSARTWPRGQHLTDVLAREAGIQRDVEVRLQACLPGPVTCGVRAPVIMFPDDATGWSDADVECAVAHELSHIARHDWAVDVVTRSICAFYWFHPLLWMAWRQLRLESERAADDAVVRRLEATGYAELLIRLAERLVVGPAQVIAMANRRDLPVRVRSVLDGSRRRDPAGRRAVVITTLAVFVVVIGTAPLTTTLGAQSAPLPTAKFDVASIRACQPPPQQPGSAGEGSHSSPGRLSTGCVRLLDANDIGLISDAYATFADGHLNWDRASTPFRGGPSWMRSAWYEITAVAQGSPSVEMMMGPMLQSLLEDRFHLKIHREMTEGAVYVLSVARGGPKLRTFTEGSCVPYSSYPPPALDKGRDYCLVQIGARSPASIEAQGVTLESFSKMLRTVLDRPVIDRTGIAGRFDVRIEFSREGTAFGRIPLAGRPPASDPAGPPSIFTVVQEQLGLRLDAAKGPVDRFVIDHIELPSEN
jgi:uncharacterized protein (TIGR03435 family)